MSVPDVHVVNETGRELKFTIVVILVDEVNLKGKDDKIIELRNMVRNPRTIRIIVRE